MPASPCERRERQANVVPVRQCWGLYALKHSGGGESASAEAPRARQLATACAAARVGARSDLGAASLHRASLPEFAGMNGAGMCCATTQYCFENRSKDMPRAIWTGSLGFGLVQIPVALHAAEEVDELSLTLLYKRDFSPVGYERITTTIRQ